MPPKPSIHRINGILDNISSELENTDFSQQLIQQGLRVELLHIGMVRPDPAQPRRVLPEKIYTAFCEQRITPVQALKEFIQLVQVMARQKGRPFANIVDLLPNTNEDVTSEAEDDSYTPEETLLRELVNLAITIRDDGQVNPLTVMDCSEGANQLFRIETGERRYWATWLMIEFLPGYTGDGTLPCIIVPHTPASVFRQAKENSSRSGLNAIAMARQAALLILHVHGVEPPSHGYVPNDFYRQALDLDLRGKREYAGEILAAMGGIQKAHLSRLKSLLKLTDEALELADRHNLDESRLRPVLSLAEEHQAEMVRQIIDFGLTRRQIEEMCLQEPTGEEDKSDPLPKETRQALKLLRSTSTANPYDIAKGLYEQEGDLYTARAFVQRLKKLLDDVEVCLREE